MNNTGGNPTPSGVEPAPELTVTREEFDSLRQELDDLRKLVLSTNGHVKGPHGVGTPQKPAARARAVTPAEKNTAQKRSRSLSSDAGVNHCRRLNITPETGGGKSPPQKKHARTAPSSTSDLPAGRKYGLSGITPHNDHNNNNEDSSGENCSFSNRQASGPREVNMKPSSEKTLARSVLCPSESNPGDNIAAEEKQRDQDNKEERSHSSMMAGGFTPEATFPNPSESTSTDEGNWHQDDVEMLQNLLPMYTNSDVLCSKKLGINLCYELSQSTEGSCHPGNRRYKSMISARKDEYLNSNEKKRDVIVNEIVKWVVQIPGRFLDEPPFCFNILETHSGLEAINDMTRRALEEGSTGSTGPTASTAQAPAPAPSNPNQQITENLSYGEKLHRMVEEGDRLSRGEVPGEAEMSACWWEEDGMAFKFVWNEGFRKMLKDFDVCQSEDIFSVRRNMNSYEFQIRKFGKTHKGEEVWRVTHSSFARDVNRDQLRQISRKKKNGNATRQKSSVVETADASAGTRGHVDMRETLVDEMKGELRYLRKFLDGSDLNKRKDMVIGDHLKETEEAQLMEDENSDYPVNNEARPIVAFPPAIVLSCTRIDDARVRPSGSVGEDMIRFPCMAVVSPSAVQTVIRGKDTDDGSHAVDYPQGRHRRARAYAFVKKLGESILGEIWVAIWAHQLSSQSDPVAEGQSGAEWEFGSLPEYFAVKRVPIANISLEDRRTSEDPIREVQAMQHFRRWYENNFHKKQSGKVETSYDEAVRIMAETNVMIPVDVLTDGSYLYIVLPYCSGGDLFDALNLSNKPCMGEEASRAFMTQVLNGLEHLQKAGLAHRDISMENILLHNGSCIIADMGQCVRVPSKGQRRCLIDHSDGALIGKSEYRPPEVWKNENYDGFAMDIWCLSITLFIALTGTYPGDSILDKCFWEGSSNRESFELGSGERKNLEETVMMCLPDGAFDLLQKCLEEDPRRRLSLQQIRDHPWMARSIKASDSPSAPTSSLCPAASVSREKVIEKVAPKTDSSSSGASKCSHKHSLSSEDAEAKLDAASKMARAVKKLAADSAVSSISYKDLEMDSSRISSYKEDSEGFALEGTSAEVQAQTDVTEKVLLRKDVFSKDNLKELGGTTRVENTREINTIIEAMRKNRQSETVQVQSCAALRDLADFNFFNCAAIGKAEGIPTVVEAMTAHQQSVRVQEAACAALRNLSSQCYHNIAAIREAGGIPAIIQAMTAHQQSVRVQEEACRALRSLAVHIKDAVCEAGGIPVIVRAMTTHVLSEEVQENACAALRLLSVNYDNAVAIREGGGISAIVQAMAAHHESDKVQYQACTALGHLANRNEENEAAIREAGGVRQIKMAKEKHAGSAEVKRAADYALKERRLERVNMRKSIRR